MTFCLAERNHLCNFGRGHYDIYSQVILVKEPGFKNVKNKHLGMPPF